MFRKTIVILLALATLANVSWCIVNRTSAFGPRDYFRQVLEYDHRRLFRWSNSQFTMQFSKSEPCDFCKRPHLKIEGCEEGEYASRFPPPVSFYWKSGPFKFVKSQNIRITLWRIEVDDWVPIPILAAYPMVFLISALRRRTRPGHCPKCSYNLTGNTSGVCPECGTAISAARVSDSSPAPPPHS